MKTGAKGTDVLLISGRHQFKKYRKKWDKHFDGWGPRLTHEDCICYNRIQSLHGLC